MRVASQQRFFVLMVACSMWRVVLGSDPQKTKHPNIVMIVADDLGWDDVSFHGSSQIPTPNIDRLANEGVILNSYYVSPICTPTRASLMTGKHPLNLGMQHATVFGTQPYGLPLGETTTPQYMKSLGYATHGIGKWHLGFFEKEYTPTYRGFDSYYGFWNGKEDYWDHSSQEDVWGLDLRDNENRVRNESGHYGTELFAERAAQVIHLHNQSKPLYLYLAQQGVHSANEREPLQAPKRLIDKFPYISSYDRRIYAAMVTALDESVGKVYKALQTSGMMDNTVLVFTTDNGGAPRGFNWNQGCNYPFKGGKDTFWEGGVRAVGFVHSDLIKKKGRVSHDLIDVTDWLPTFYQLGGGDAKRIQNRMDGMNVWDTISEGAPSPRTEVLHNIDPIRKFAAIRVNNYKLIVNQDSVYKTTWIPRYEVTNGPNDESVPKTLPGAVVDCGKWSKTKGNDCDTDKFPCLFDLSQDPCEYNDIAQSNLAIVRKLLKRLVQHQNKAKPVWFPVRDPSANPADFKGFWSPWQNNPANQGILDAVRDSYLRDVSQDCCHGNATTREYVYRGDKELHKILHKILLTTAEASNKLKTTAISKKERDRIGQNMNILYRGMEKKIHDKERDSSRVAVRKKPVSTKKQNSKSTLSRKKRWDHIIRRKSSTGSQHGIEISRNKVKAVKESLERSIIAKHAVKSDKTNNVGGRKEAGEFETVKTVRKMLKQNIVDKHEKEAKGGGIFDNAENDERKYFDEAEGNINDDNFEFYQKGAIVDGIEGNNYNSDSFILHLNKASQTKRMKKPMNNKTKNKWKTMNKRRSEIPSPVKVRKEVILSALTDLFGK